MSAYFLLDVSAINDEAKMEEYRRGVFATVERYRGRYLIIGGEQRPLEGNWQPTFPVLIEFENLEQANRWYTSDEYRDLLKLRLEATDGWGVLIDGYRPS
ncbi:MAG: DUF1330 domain-containing protein [Pyrinomonadaceae bacterium]